MKYVLQHHIEYKLKLGMAQLQFSNLDQLNST